MRRTWTKYVLSVCLSAAMTFAWAQGAADAQTQSTIWSCVDKGGRKSMTNIKEDTEGKDCRVIHQQRVTVVPAPATANTGPKPAAKSASPAGFPKETASDRQSARDRQRQALAGELAGEESLLTKAKAELAQQEAYRSGDEKNYAKVVERLQKYRDNVQLHEKNVEELRKELGKLR